MIKFLKHPLYCLIICVNVLHHGLVFSHPTLQVVEDIVLEEAHEGFIFFEFVKQVYAEAVHIVVDSDNLPSFRCPKMLHLLPKNQSIFF